MNCEYETAERLLLSSHQNTNLGKTVSTKFLSKVMQVHI